MKIFKNRKELINEILNKKNIAFVPTMGSIHAGHLSLIKRAQNKSKNVLVTIYINPKQFSSNSDFNKYPRNVDKDISLLRKAKIRYLFIPTDKDIYSFRTKSPIYLDKFSKQLCGKFRPKHFKGVVNVINRFLEIIKPSSIYLGVKDFQQLALIRIHVNKNKIPTKVISCPTVRHNSGIALSSRNIKLKKKQFRIAGQIYKYLTKEKKNALSKNSEIKKLKFLNKITLLGVNKIEYLECVNLETLKTSKKINRKCNIFIAYYMGKIRLIDNL